MAQNGWYQRVGQVYEVRAGQLELVTSLAAITRAEKVAMFYRPRERKGQTVKEPALLVERTTKVLLASAELLDGLPAINAVYGCPVLAERNGVLVGVTGYDKPTGVYAQGEPPVEMPLDRAKDVLLHVLQDYAPVDSGDRARMVASMITPGICFGGLLGPVARVPMTVVEADDSQAGKGLFCNLLATIYGSTAAIVAQTKKGVGSLEEGIARQLLLARPFVQIDNVRGRVDLPYLEAVLTESSVECRVAFHPGVSVDPRRTCFLLTSNKAELTCDLANRANIIRIRKQPRSYEFREWPEGGLVEHVEANKALYLGAVYSILGEWHRLGKPRADDDGGHDFRVWARGVRWIVGELLDIGDPIQGAREVQRRTSNVAITWMRDVALAVAGAERTGVELTASDLLDLLAASNVELPGVGLDEDTEDEGVRAKVLRALGRRFASVFRDGNVVQVDDMHVLRTQSPELNPHGKHDRSYRVEPCERGKPGLF